LINPPFYYHPRMLAYDFGPEHPLKPERLRRAVPLIRALTGIEPTDPGPGKPEDALRIHADDYVHAVRNLSGGDHLPNGYLGNYGFGSVDNPPFLGMYEAALAYLAGTVRAAEDVRGGAPLAINLSGGLHHAHRARASGFCVFDDPAVALAILRERFDRVAYIDIDVHHGDGPQWLFYDDHRVLTCSIHQTGRTLFPATGFVNETGPAFTSVNVPLEAGTTGDVWLWAFSRGILPAIGRFKPQAIVLQMGTDPHDLDPLGRLRLTVQEWVEAVRLVRDLGLPIVATGGGGYNLDTVPRMWAAAVLTLMGLEVPEALPEPLASEWGVYRFFDTVVPGPRGSRLQEAEDVIAELETLVLPNVPSP
jgi:acetoin utilization protein AcuC